MHVVAIPEMFPAACKEYPHQECLHMDGHWWWVCPGCGVAWFRRLDGLDNEPEIVVYRMALQAQHNGNYLPFA